MTVKKIVLDPERDVRRLARALHNASWRGDVPWSKLKAPARSNYIDDAKRIMAALETDAEHNAGRK